MTECVICHGQAIERYCAECEKRAREFIKIASAEMNREAANLYIGAYAHGAK